jgi:four helix bundle protein
VAGAKTFQELVAWQLTARLRDEVVALCATPPLRVDLSLRDQLRESACSAPALIAEGFGRFSHRDFGRYLTMARAELLELQNHLDDLRARRIVAGGTVEELLRKSDLALRTVTRLRSSLR